LNTMNAERKLTKTGLKKQAAFGSLISLEIGIIEKSMRVVGDESSLKIANAVTSLMDDLVRAEELGYKLDENLVRKARVYIERFQDKAQSVLNREEERLKGKRTN